jgi:hypothetical protein
MAITCLYKTVDCGLSTPCRKCREVSSHVNRSAASYRGLQSYGGVSASYWSRRRR